MQQCDFWFPAVELPAAFDTAFAEANRAVGPKDSENTVYHPHFERAWDAVFPPCTTHPRSRVSGCAACSVPIKKRFASNGPEGFGEDAPDYLFSAPDSGVEVWAGVLDIKRKDGRATSFTKDDITQVVRYGHHLLATQPLRDHATVCLFTLERVQFFQVFRGTSVIRKTESSSLLGRALGQLYSYFTAPAATHGIREIALDGYVCVCVCVWCVCVYVCDVCVCV